MRAESRPLPGVVASLAGRQHGVISRSQLLRSAFRRRRFTDGSAAATCTRSTAASTRSVIPRSAGRRAGSPRSWPAGRAPFSATGRPDSYSGSSRAASATRSTFRSSAAPIADPPASSLTAPGRLIPATRRSGSGSRPRPRPERSGISATTFTPTADPPRLRAGGEAATCSTGTGSAPAPRGAQPSHRGAATYSRCSSARPALPLAETRSWLEEIICGSAATTGCRCRRSTCRCSATRSTSSGPRARCRRRGRRQRPPRPGRRDQDNERDIALGRAGYLVRRTRDRARRPRGGRDGGRRRSWPSGSAAEPPPEPLLGLEDGAGPTADARPAGGIGLVALAGREQRCGQRGPAAAAAAASVAAVVLPTSARKRE